jgi:hypothetical protein
MQFRWKVTMDLRVYPVPPVLTSPGFRTCRRSTATVVELERQSQIHDPGRVQAGGFGVYPDVPLSQSVR